jgi:hypothetical protein
VYPVRAASAASPTIRPGLSNLLSRRRCQIRLVTRYDRHIGPSAGQVPSDGVADAPPPPTIACLVYSPRLLDASPGRGWLMTANRETMGFYRYAPIGGVGNGGKGAGRAVPAIKAERALSVPKAAARGR